MLTRSLSRARRAARRRPGVGHLLFGRDKKWKKGPTDPDELLTSMVPVRPPKTPLAASARAGPSRRTCAVLRRRCAALLPRAFARSRTPRHTSRSARPRFVLVVCRCVLFSVGVQISSVRVVFIRHGESEWNDVFNKGIGPVRRRRRHATLLR